MIPYQQLTVPSDGALSFVIRDSNQRPWWWYLDLNGAPLYLVGNACGTCEAIYKRVQDINLPITPHELSEQFTEGLQIVSDDIIHTVIPLLPKGDYIVNLIELRPTRLDRVQRPNFVGCEADYFWWKLFYQRESEAAYELILPFVAESTLSTQRIDWYCTQIKQGNKPTALALSIVDQRAVSGQFTEWALTHFLLDGHHKIMAASQMGQPITLLSFLRETSLTGIPMIDELARAYYSGSEIK